MSDRSYGPALDVVLGCMAEAVLLHDADGRIVYANDAAATLVGDDPVGLSAEDLIRRLGLARRDGSPLSISDLASAKAQVRRSVQREVYVLTARDPRAVVASVVAPVVEDGVRYTVAVWHDVTGRYAAETEREDILGRLETAVAAQQRERDVLEALMENTPAHLAYLDREMRFIAVNATYAAGSGHERADLIGRGHFELFPNAENEAIFARVRDTGEAMEYRAKPFEFADQPWRGVTYWDWRLSPVKDAGGEVQGLVLSLVDVTDTVRAKRYSDALNHLNEVIHATLDIDVVLAQVVPELAAAVGCEVVGVALRTEDSRWLLAETYGLPPTHKGLIFSEDDFPASSAALASGSIVIASGPDDPLVAGGIAGTVGVQSMLWAPLALPDKPLGAIAFGYTSGPGTFDAPQIDFVGKVSASLALALNNARTFENEHRVAHVLQESMLALPSSIEGVRFAHEYQAASEASLVGGDFYDLFEIEHGVLGVLIGDVAGKGLDAAVLTSVVKNTVRAHAAERGNSPARVLELTNDLLYRSTAPEAFATVFFGVLDLAEGRLRYVNAGHTAAGILRDGDVTALTSTAPLLGAFRGTAMSEAEAAVASHDVLFLYTDGLIEARSPASGEQFGEERLLSVLAKLEPEPRAAVAAVLAEAVGFAEGNLRDDVAILAVQNLTG